MKLGKLPKKSEVAAVVRNAIAANAADDSLIEAKQTPEVRTPEESVTDDNSPERIQGERKLSRLIEGDFPFDESQLDAIEGLSSEPYACLTGAAGTGKTTTTKAVVDRLLDGKRFNEVNMLEYFKRGEPEADPDDVDDRDESEKPTWVPSVAMCAYTGRASQMIKKNFPRDWHGNIMTIHRLLAFMPEYYDDWDEESDSYSKKMRFIPTYNADCKLPWDHIIIDEAGMLSVDLWEQLWAACKDGCRITMIGDINQLPPVHGKSVFGFAMAKWPTWELKKVHRQKGSENPIVDNAWRIIHGQMPESGGRFQMIPLKGDAQVSSRLVRKMLPELMKREIYDPIRDTCITPINGEDGAKGFALGQLPLNREFALIFNDKPKTERFIIDGGRERKQFAIGDKVMATKNDWQAGITNGMTGVIVDIAENGDYGGDRSRFGSVQAVNDFMRDNPDEDHTVAFTLDELQEDLEATASRQAKQKEKRERGPSSHTVTVRFGSEDHGFEIPFTTLSEVGSLMTAYVVTCHKMQGGESPTVVIICHDAHKSMLYREWLYTAVTRASEKCILLYTPTALRTAISKQAIKGQTLREKVESFNAVVGWAQPTLPDTASTRNLVMDREEERFVTPARLQSTAVKTGGLAQLINKQRESQAVAEPTHEETRVDVRVDVRVQVKKTFVIKTVTPTPTVVDGGDVTPKAKQLESLPAPECRDVIVAGPVHTLAQAARPEPLRLTHTPKPANRLALRLGMKK